MKPLWTPRLALEQAGEKGIGSHHVIVREPNLRCVTEATWEAIQFAVQQGKPKPQKPLTAASIWVGHLYFYPDELSHQWATVYMLEAPRTCNLATNALDAFGEDGTQLRAQQKKGILPILVVTEISYTRRLVDPHEKVMDPNYFDSTAPDTIQAIALEQGVCVLRTTQTELPHVIRPVMRAIHLGQAHPSLIIP